ncbi:MAG: NADH-quinone oxidoreductase subunit NuoF [Candidatus Dasytiphilus stammeri]
MKKKINRTEETHPLTWMIQEDKKTVWFKEYCSKNGYTAIKKTLKTMKPEEIVSIVKASELKGRGGAGFYTGLKWSLMKKKVEDNDVRYLLCNADEMEPGTYKDRMLLEQLPHLLIEGMLIAAFALQANRGYIFLRCEYVEAAITLDRAIIEATKANLLGKNILGYSFNFNISIHTGAGRYICGEETALINSLEGRRANPRAKPPFPAEVGLWGKPTCINNVETLCNIPPIIQHGIDWYKSLSINSNDTGTKLMGFSGRVKIPGLWELPFGISAGEILENYAGGMHDGLKLKAWQPGGASTNFLTQDHLDLPMDFNSLNKIGSRLGTGIALAVDDKINMVSLTYNLEKFFSRESCGLCTPCREGLPWIVKILKEIDNKNGCVGDIELLEELCDQLGSGKSFCFHAPGAVEPLKSALKYFRNEFNSGISQKNTNEIKNNIISSTNLNLMKIHWE